MKTTMRGLAFGAALTATLSMFGAAAHAERPAVGEPAPPLELVATDGQTYTLTRDMEGPRVVIFFRGSW